MNIEEMKARAESAKERAEEVWMCPACHEAGGMHYFNFSDESDGCAECGWESEEDGNGMEAKYYLCVETNKFSAITDDVLTLLAENARLREKLGRLTLWTSAYGKNLCPTGADTYGEGVRACKDQVRRLL